MALDNNLMWGDVVPKGSDLGFHTMLCCICLGLATYCHQRCMWSCRTVTYRERRPCILDARLEFSSWFYTMVSFAHVLVSLCHQQGMEPPWCPGVGPPWTWLYFINKPKESYRLRIPLNLMDRVRVCVHALSLRELWLFVTPKPKEEKMQFSGHKEQKRFYCSLVCLKQTDQ